MRHKREQWWGGIDEAGYGPTLGPLVLSLTVFRVREEKADLWERFSGLVARPGGKGDLIVGDSKRLYSRQQGIGRLERGVLSFYHVFGHPLPAGSKDFLNRIGFEAWADHPACPWYGGEIAVPLDARAADVRQLSFRLKKIGERKGIGFEDVRILPVLEDRFNREMEERGNKANLLFYQTARLMKYFFEKYGEGRLFVDRHGGRKHYRALLAEAFSIATVQTIEKTDALSRYGVKGKKGEGEISFIKKGEHYSFPVALASMFSKYTRELFMVLFNNYWKVRALHVKPTAGYPQDAARFLREIRPFLEKGEEQAFLRIR